MLSAAHCVLQSYGFAVEVILGRSDDYTGFRTYKYSRYFLQCLLLYSGEHNISDDSESRKLTIRGSPPFKVHSRYQKSEEHGYVVYDFVLLRLAIPVNYASYRNIRPICLPTRDAKEYEENVAGLVAGWGQTVIRQRTIGDLITGLGSHLSDVLHKLNVR